MSNDSSSFSKGDWIVHSYYGVGQIAGIEKKILDDVQEKYFKVETQNSTYFIPTKKVDEDRIRPVASKYMLRKAIKAFKSTPQELDPDHNQRKRQLSELVSDLSLVASAELVRDLIARQTTNGLNDHEENTLHKLTERFVQEWAITQEIDYEQALEKFEQLVQETISA